MPSQIDDAHGALRSFCETNAGIGISKDLFLHLLREHIQRSQVYLSGLPSNYMFEAPGESLSVSFDVTLDTEDLKLNLHRNDGTSPIVGVNGFKSTLKAQIENHQICEITIEFKDLVARLLLIDKKLKLKLIEYTHTETDFQKLWETNTNTRSYFESRCHFENDVWDRLVHHFKAISIVSAGEIAETFLEAIVFPDIFSVFRGIAFGSGGRLEVNDKKDLLMLSASSSLNFDQCPVDPVDGTIRFDPSPVGQPDAHRDGEPVGVTVSDDSPARSYRSHGDNIESLDSGQVFLYTPIQLLNANFNGVVKPAVRIADSASWGPFYYRWEITPGLQGKFTLTLEKSWPITFRIKAPLEVSGQAGAGIKIGSVRHEAVGVMFQGNVDPFDIDFRIMLDWPRREILFESTITDIKARDFHFTTMPIGFPVNQIVDVILSAVAKTIVNEQAGKILSATRIPIANLRLLEEVAELVQGLAGYSDCDGNATMGVLYKIDVGSP